MRNDYNLSSQRFMTELDSPETHIYISTRGVKYKKRLLLRYIHHLKYDLTHIYYIGDRNKC